MNWKFWNKSNDPKELDYRVKSGHLAFNGSPHENLEWALVNGDHVASRYWADVCQLEMYSQLEEKREYNIRIHGKPPSVNYCTTAQDCTEWEVSEEYAIEHYGYQLPGEIVGRYQTRIKADIERLS